MSDPKARACEMLKVAAKYIRDTWPDGIAHYDGTDCDGYCVADDCESAAEILAEADLSPSANKVAELVEAAGDFLDAIFAEYENGDRKLRITGPTANLKWLIEAEEELRAALAKLEGGE